MSSGRLAGWAGWIALALFLTTYSLDCTEDIRGRDCFSWMDPTQYYTFAASIARGEPLAGGFEVASSFPFFVAPFVRAGGGTIPSALASNILSAILLACVVVFLARMAGIRSHPVVPVVLVLAAPLLVGLSRELYVEYTLSWLVGLAFVLWFRSDRLRRPIHAVLFGFVFAAGLLLKMTFGVFFVGVVLSEAWSALRARAPRRLLTLAAGFLLPAVIVVAGIHLLFPDSFRYYASLGNTRIPIMRLIGPADLFSGGSLFYYVWQLGRTVLGLLSVFLIVPVFLAGRLLLRSEDDRYRTRLIDLALWILAPIVLLTFQTVKEPRHIAPVAIPAAILITAAVERIRRPRLRSLLLASALVVAVAQYLLLTRGPLPCPYRLSGGLSPRLLEETMIRADPEKGPMRTADGRLDINRWRFTRSIALSGFEPNQALALAWWFAPAVVYDLSLDQWNERDETAYARFEDLFYFSSLNIYNARCNWAGRYYTLDREAVVSHADFILARGSEEGLRGDFPAHDPVATFEGREPLHVLVARESRSESYRDLYAAALLERSHPTDSRELNTIYFSFFMNSCLRGETPDETSLLPRFPVGFEPGSDRRNVFWIAHDFPLQAYAGEAFARRSPRGD